ncbi:MAG: hypothetical protein COA69_06990 [Robiginitomaculum sp.]|nr:MAG: hypothetical protein COA69_06990 [Robiginitomaculum sp.]
MTIASTQNDGKLAEFWEPRRALTLDAARRHSAFIRIARRALLGSAALLAATLVWYFIRTPKAMTLTPSPDETVKMVNPIYKGRTADGSPYRITANDAIRFIQNPDEVKLAQPILNFLRTDGAKESVVLAVSGLYDSKNQILNLNQDVKLDTDDGYRCKTGHSRIFVKEKRIEGDGGIDCTGTFGKAAGNGYEINDGYTEFVFKDGMVAQFIPNEADDALRGLSTIGLASTSKGPKASFGTDRPVDVSADRGVYRGPKTVLTGNVDVRQEDARILADQMDLVREIEWENEDGTIKYGNVNRIVAVGNFKYTNPESTVTGNKGVYERDKNTITVTGNVRYTQASGNSVTGCSLVYDLMTNRASFDGRCGQDTKQNGRVTIKTGQ